MGLDIDKIAAAIHYPDCWDTAAYPTLESALSEVFASFRCTNEDTHTATPIAMLDGMVLFGVTDDGSTILPPARNSDGKSIELYSRMRMSAATAPAGEKKEGE